MDKSSSLGCPRDTPGNIQEVQASKLGDAQGIPSSSIKSTRSFSMRYIFIASCIMCYSWSIFIFCCVFTVFHKVGPHHILFWRETRSAVLHIYFGVRHAPLLCIVTLE